MDKKRNIATLLRYKRKIRLQESGFSQYDKRKLYMGTSMSACMGDILAGYMPLDNIIAMVSNTALTGYKDVIKWRDHYRLGDNFKHKLTGEHYPCEDWDRAIDHILLKCVFIQHRITHSHWDRNLPHPFVKVLNAPKWVPVTKQGVRRWAAQVNNLI